MDLSKKRVMIVEDEKIMSTFITNSLRRLNIQDLHVFEDGLQALKVVVKLSPDLILTDVHMEPMGGIEFVRHLRSSSNPKVRDIKVIFLSADATSTTVGAALPLGVSGYIVKPPELKALAAKIEQALSS
jgi:CheY-like chemotaxis protein